MQTVARLTGFLLLMVFLSCSAFGQGTAGASISATIVSPIGLEKSVDLDFGNVAAGMTAGSVQLNPDGTRLSNGGSVLPTPNGNVTAAKFTVTGAPNFTYSILLPSAVQTVQNGPENMTVDAFSSDPPLTGNLGSGGVQELRVGARLNVGAYQPEGTYLSVNDFLVTVNYN